MNNRAKLRLLALTLCGAAAGNAHAFLALNDLASHVPNQYDGTNVTAYGLGSANQLLEDMGTGAQPGYTLSVTPDPRGDANTSGTTSNGSNPELGTDADDIFEDYVDMIRYIQGNSGFGYVDLIFAGLTAGVDYFVAVFGERSPASDGRPTLFTLSGADAFVNVSSAGTSFAGASDPSVSYDTAPNNTTGYIAQFSGIDAGADGTFSIRVQAPTGSSQNWYVNAVAFGTAPVPAPASLGLMAIGLVALGGLCRRHRYR